MNKNCLLGFQCPNCGSYGPFRIEVTTVILFHDDGSDLPDSEMIWEDDSYCKCGNCSREGTVKDFKTEKSHD